MPSYNQKICNAFVILLGKIQDYFPPKDSLPKSTVKTEMLPGGHYDPFKYKAETPDSFEFVVNTNVCIC